MRARLPACPLKPRDLPCPPPARQSLECILLSKRVFPSATKCLPAVSYNHYSIF